MSMYQSATGNTIPIAHFAAVENTIRYMISYQSCGYRIIARPIFEHPFNGWEIVKVSNA